MGDRMPDAGRSAVVGGLDVFEVELRAGERRKEGRLVKLQEHPFRVLSLLLERAGEVVPRKELRLSVWPADTFVDFDHGLNSAVARLREALRDSADKPRFIETVAKRGYRFIYPVHAALPAIPVAAPRVDGAWNKEHARVAAWTTGVPLLALCCTIGLWALYRKTPEEPLSSIQVAPPVGPAGFPSPPPFFPPANQPPFPT